MSLEKNQEGALVHIPLLLSRYKPEDGNSITIIQQKYETGTNILQKPTAKCLLSIRRGMTIRDALQSISRMRQIRNNQSIEFMLSEEVAADINVHDKNAALDSKTLWRYFAQNQAKQEEDKNWLAACQRMREAVEKPIRQALADTKRTPKARLELFKKAKELIIKNEKSDPFNALKRASVGLDAKDAIKLEVDRYMALWMSLPSDITAQEPDMEKRLYSSVDELTIPEIIYSRDMVVGQELEQEEEKETEQEHEVQEDSEANLPKHKPYLPLTTLSQESGYALDKLVSTSFNPITHILPRDVQVEAHKKLFFSSNLFIDDAAPGTQNHGTYHLAARYMLITQEADKPARYTLINHMDAAHIKKGLSSQRLDSSQFLALVTLSGNQVAASDANRAKTLLESDEFGTICAHAKIITGRVNFTKKEISYLNSSTPNKEPLAKLYERIIKYKPATAKRYIGSYLQSWFTKA